MMVKMCIHISEDELQAIQAFAEKEMRPIREQIRFMLRQDLHRLGYLQTSASDATPSQLKIASESSQDQFR
jgi:hypothetical protein